MIAWIKSLFCAHKDRSFVRNIYGDEIIECGWKRSIWRCTACNKWIYDNSLHGIGKDQAS